jgi:hypothetical protein
MIDTVAYLNKYRTDVAESYVKADIPNCPLPESNLSVKIDLRRFLDSVIKEGHYSDMGSIESICLYGPVLYRNFPPKTKELHKRRYRFFGPITTKIVEQPREIPASIDFLAITTDEVKKGNRDAYCSSDPGALRIYGCAEFSYYNHIADFSNGGMWWEPRMEIAADIRVNFMAAGELGEESEDLRKVLCYCVPIIGEHRFEEIINSDLAVHRNPLHSIHWENDGDTLVARVIEKET